jgi:hypothetical protein
MDLRCGNRFQNPPDLPNPVLANQPAPVRERPVIHELHDHGLLVFPRIKILEVIGPKERPEVVGKVSSISAYSCSERHECFYDPYAVKYTDFASFYKPHLTIFPFLLSLESISPMKFARIRYRCHYVFKGELGPVRESRIFETEEDARTYGRDLKDRGYLVAVWQEMQVRTAAGQRWQTDLDDPLTEPLDD